MGGTASSQKNKTLSAQCRERNENGCAYERRVVGVPVIVQPVVVPVPPVAVPVQVADVQVVVPVAVHMK